MKKILALLLVLAQCKFGATQTPEHDLQQLLAAKDYFKLDSVFNRHTNQLTNNQQLYYRAFLDNAFNRNTACIRDVNEFFSGNANIPDSVAARLRRLQSASYVKTFQYAAAANTDSLILHDFHGALDSATTDDIENDLLFRKALAGVPAQTVTFHQDQHISWKKNEFNLMMVPVTANGSVFDAVFDTRAEYSCITESFLNKLGVRKLDVTFNEGSGLTDISFKASLGVVDSIYLGGILFKNVVFLVMPDESLHFKQADVDVQLNLIVGAPMIEQLGEFHIRKTGDLYIPASASPSALHNMATEFYSPVIRLQMGGDWLHFYLDLGAATSQFFYEFYDRYRELVQGNGKKGSIHLAGAGGIVKKDVYTLPSIQLSTGTATATLKDVSVLTQPVQNSSHHYGNIGQDFVDQFDEVIFNFRDMYFSARKK